MRGRAGTVLAALLLAAVCGCGSAISSSNGQRAIRTTCGGPSFALSLSSKARGESSPERAGATFARTNPTFAEPLSSWHVVSRVMDVAQLQSGTFRLEAIRVSNGTWLVDAGGCAAE